MIKDILPAPISTESNYLNEKDYYVCTNCSSNIEILSIDDKEATITFNCLNNDDSNNNHKTQKMGINEYIKKMVKNTYFYDECSICHIKQNSLANLPIFKYCTICKNIICDDCHKEFIIKRIKFCDNEHIFINNNEKNIKCLIHPYNNNIVFCFDCKKHLCNECLRTKIHIKHKKNNLYEIMPLDEDKIIYNKIIELLR